MQSQYPPIVYASRKQILDHLDGAFEEFAEGFAFQQAVGQEGQVGELVDELFLLLGIGLVEDTADERVVDVDHEVVALRQFAVEAHAAA